MSNFDKAVEIIGELATEYGQPGGDELFGLDEDAALALKENGLLAPDLPRPTRDRLWQTSALELGIRTVHYAADQVVVHTSRGREHTHYKQARDLAMALLAAANYAEKGQGNE